MTTPGDTLKKWREERGLSQTEAGKQLDPPVTQGCWGAWETGRKPPNLTNALSLEALTDGHVAAAHWSGAKKARRGARRSSRKRAGTDVATTAARAS